MSVRIVDRILGERVPDFFSPLEKDMGIDLVQCLISGDASRLPNELKYLAEVIEMSFY